MTASPLLRINAIGCGRLGQTLLRLWHQQQRLEIGGILTTSADSARQAVRVIGAGTVVTEPEALPAAELVLIASPDHAIAPLAQQLAERGVLTPGAIVFHCSGALSSALLQPCRQQGAAIASIHPIKSFADVDSASLSFAGSWCGCEGDATALTVLEPLFSDIGGHCFPIRSAHKTLYHSASVMACNYLVALQQISLELFEAAGVPAGLGARVLAPLTHGTLDAVFTQGAVAALTGPIARGDSETVQRQLEALRTLNPESAELYRLLGLKTLQLAQQKGQASPPGLAEIAELLAQTRR